MSDSEPTGISANWPVRPLGDLIDVVAGQSPPGSTLNEAGEGIPFYQGSRDFGRVYPTPRVSTTAPTRLAEVGDVLLSVRAPVGEVNLANEPCAIGRGVMAVRGRPGEGDTRFLYHLLKSLEPEWQQLESSGSVFSNLGKEDLKRIARPIPNVPEQRAIADVLGAIDDAIEANRRTIALSQDFHRVGYAALLAEQNWGQVAMFDSSRPIARVEFGAPYAGRMFSEPGVGRPLVRIRDLKTFDPAIWTTERISGEVLVEPGDLLVGMDAEFRPVIWLGESAVLNQRCCRFSPVGDVPLSFLIEALRSPLAFFERAKTGTTVSHLNKADIVTFKAPDVPAERLREFGEIFDPAIALQVQLSAETRELERALALLRPELITGRIRVPVRAEAHAA